MQGPMKRRWRLCVLNAGGCRSKNEESRCAKDDAIECCRFGTRTTLSEVVIKMQAENDGDEGEADGRRAHAALKPFQDQLASPPMPGATAPAVVGLARAPGKYSGAVGWNACREADAGGGGKFRRVRSPPRFMAANCSSTGESMP